MATQVAFSDLDSWLQAQPVNTVDTPYEIEITGLTASDCGDSTNAGTLGYILSINNWNKYVDLRETVFPNMTELYNTFGSCGLVYAPPIPNTVTLLYETYSGCSYLKTAPVIPETVTSMEGCFGNCTSLSEPPTIPSSVRNLEKCFRGCNFTTSPILPNSLNTMKRAFYNCTKLVNAPIIPEGVQYMESAFEGCSLLSHKPIKPSSVQYSSGCYTGVTTKNWKGTSSQVETFNPTCPDDCEIQIYNNDRVTLEDTFLNVDISTLSTYLAGLDPNTVSTAYKIYIRGLTTSNASDIRVALLGNRTKYVDLSYTIIPDNTDCTDLFLDNNPLNEENPLVYAPVLPAVNTNTQLTSVFAGCNNLQEAPVIPNIYTSLQYAFSNCISLTQTPEIPVSVTNTQGAFMGCLALTTVQNLPSNVVFGSNAFKNCSSLTKIDEFKIPLNTIKNNTNFQDMFANCPALETIGFKVDTDKWHAWRLKFNGSSVEGKVFGIEQGQVVSTAIQNTQISQDDIKLPVLTDELWFPDSIMTDSAIEDVITDVLNNRYTYWKKPAIDPSSKSLVMMASDPDNVVSNFLGSSTPQEMFNIVHPVGEIYIQYPQQKDPADLYNHNGVTSTWTLQTQYAGAFFRSSGGNASSFIEEGNTLTAQGYQNAYHRHEGTYTGTPVNDDSSHSDSSYTGAPVTNNSSHTSYTSTDSAGSHTHALRAKSNSAGSVSNGYPLSHEYSGIIGNASYSNTTMFYNLNNRSNYPTISTEGSHSHPYNHIHAHRHVHSITTGYNGNSSVQESRPTNYTIKIWKRTS